MALRLSLPQLLLLALVLLLQPLRARSHNWLTHPPAFNPNFATRDCQGAECTNACPRILEPSRMRNTVGRPAATWARGQTVKVAWARNNHHGGLIRLSLVPVPQMNSRAAHARFALQFGCWESGEYACAREGDTCGTDRAGRAFKRHVRVPRVFVDGDYVLGYVWYGGLHFRRRRGMFADFHSCAFVRVRGGARAGGRHRAAWVAGTGARVVAGRCLTASTSVGLCGRNGCAWRRAFYGTSSRFRGRRPRRVSAGDVRRAFRGGSGGELAGVCKGTVCCEKRCGKCAGVGCGAAPGGAAACCASTIERSGRRCDRVDPPCVRG